METILDIMEVQKLLPHRYPFLLVDKVIELGEDNITAVKNVSVNEPFFQGHFPHEPIMPGVLQVEAMAQSAGIWAMKKVGRDSGSSVYFLTIDKAKFRKPAVPGDTIAYHVDKIAHRRNMWWYRAEAKVQDVLIAEAEVGAVITEA